MTLDFMMKFLLFSLVTSACSIIDGVRLYGGFAKRSSRLRHLNDGVKIEKLQISLCEKELVIYGVGRNARLLRFRGQQTTMFKVIPRRITTEGGDNWLYFQTRGVPDKEEFITMEELLGTVESALAFTIKPPGVEDWLERNLETIECVSSLITGIAIGTLFCIFIVWLFIEPISAAITPQTPSPSNIPLRLCPRQCEFGQRSFMNVHQNELFGANRIARIPVECSVLSDVPLYQRIGAEFIQRFAEQLFDGGNQIAQHYPDGVSIYEISDEIVS